MDKRTRQLYAIHSTFSVLALLFVLMRIYVRGFMRKSWGLDDTLIVVTQIVFTVYFGCAIAGVAAGSGHHNADLPVKNVELSLRYWIICELLYVVITCMLKVSVGVFLLRITVRPIHIWTLRFLMLGTVVFGLIYLIIGGVQCTPISNYWTVPRRGCMSPRTVVNAGYVGAVMNSLADWTFGLLPIFIIRDLHMSRKTKILVGGILSFAAIGNIGTVIRIPYISTLSDMDDFLYATVDLAILSTVELGVGVVAACAATLRPLLRAITRESDDGSFRHRNPIIIGSAQNRIFAGSWPRGSHHQVGMDLQPLAEGGNPKKNGDGQGQIFIVCESA